MDLKKLYKGIRHMVHTDIDYLKDKQKNMVYSQPMIIKFEDFDSI